MLRVKYLDILNQSPFLGTKAYELKIECSPALKEKETKNRLLFLFTY